MIVKLSKSGKQVLFLSDSGIVYALPASLMSRLLYGGVEAGWLCPSRFPTAVDMSRFPSSKLFVPSGYAFDLFDDSSVVQDSDGLNSKRREKVELPVGDVML